LEATQKKVERIFSARLIIVVGIKGDKRQILTVIYLKIGLFFRRAYKKPSYGNIWAQQRAFFTKNIYFEV